MAKAGRPRNQKMRQDFLELCKTETSLAAIGRKLKISTQRAQQIAKEFNIFIRKTQLQPIADREPIDSSGV